LGYIKKTAFILGNGPSLLNFNLSKASRLGLIVGTNASSFLCKELGIEQDIYCVNDLRFLRDKKRRKNSGEFLTPEKTIRYVGNECIDEAPYYSGKTRCVKILGADGISSNMQSGIFHAYSIVNFALQICMSLRIKNIVLCGIDFTYFTSMPRYYESKLTHYPDPVRGKQIKYLVEAIKIASTLNINCYITHQNSLMSPYIKLWAFK